MTKSHTDPATKLSIRRATVADARAIADLVVRGWQAAYRDLMPADFLGGLSVPSREVAWRSMLEGDVDGLTPAWIAERNGRAVGFVSVGPPRDDEVPLPAAEVYALYVLPEAWRGGVGRSLLTTAVEYLRTRGAALLTLWVLEDNGPGRAFYEVMGWEPDGARQPLEMAGFSVTEVRYRLPAPE
jgi:GNAT superfamily N-acetyltransferase